MAKDKRIQMLGPKLAQLQQRRFPSPRITGRRLQERNARLARRAPLCIECLREGRTEAATEWDHVVPLHLGGADHESNLQGLCHECHKAKTSREAIARANGTAVMVEQKERTYTLA
jgi:5-methylcytosine-specific restriction protein A